MARYCVEDWDDAYANGAYIKSADTYPDKWASQAQAFRNESDCKCDLHYGTHQRQTYDLFFPEDKPQGLFVFVHGGYWLAFDKSFWSHLAAGALQNGFAAAIPSYVLCPEAKIEDIVQMVARAIEHAAAEIDGPILLSGHSAGGHLVSSMVTTNAPISQNTISRISHTVSISGLHDLRPLLKTKMNSQLRLTEETAVDLSPALQQPVPKCRLTAYVGGDERPEFLRQSKLQSNIWAGLGANTECVIENNRNHFDVIDGLQDPNSHIMKTILNF